MTANTPNYTIPYPEITDFVKDGATAMENIAERVDDVLFAQVANRNLLYNGAMQVAQRSTSAVSGITASGFYTVDRWKIFLNTAGTWTQTPDTDVPTGQGFRRSFKMTCTTAKASLSAGDFLGMHQLLEGQDLQAIRKGTASAKQLTVSFWVKSNKTGTYIFELFDTDNNRAISKSYSINSANTWEYKTVTMSADTTGQLDNDNNLSLEVVWWLAAGSTYNSGSLQTSWGTTTNSGRAFGQSNLADTVNNYWQVTGVQLSIGATDVPFQFKSQAQDLYECQRYFEKSYAQGTSPGTANVSGAVMACPGTVATSTTGSMDGWVTFATTKRSGASVTVYDVANGFAGKCRRTKIGVANNDNQSTQDISSDPNGFYVRSAGSADANTMSLHFVASAEF